MECDEWYKRLVKCISWSIELVIDVRGQLYIDSLVYLSQRTSNKFLLCHY